MMNQNPEFFKATVSGNDLTIAMNQDPGSAFQGTYTMNSGAQSLSGESGWVKVTSGEKNPYVLTLEFTGMDANNQTEFIEWLEERTSLNVAAGDSFDSVKLSGWDGRNPDAFVWTFADFNTLGNSVALTGFSAQNVPEPSTWVLLLLSAVALLVGRKKFGLPQKTLSMASAPNGSKI